MNMPQKSIQYEQYEFKKWKAFDAETIVEAPVSLTVNGEVWLSFMCTPVNLEALAVGFLYNEGIIEKMSEVEDARVCEHGDNIDVWLNHEAKQPTSWRRTSGCTGGVTKSSQRRLGVWSKCCLRHSRYIAKQAESTHPHYVMVRKF
jgi:FdhD protein